MKFVEANFRASTGTRPADVVKLGLRLLKCADIPPRRRDLAFYLSVISRIVVNEKLAVYVLKGQFS